MASQAEGLDLSRNSFSSASKEQYPYCYPRAILLPVFVRPGLPAGAEPWLHRPSPPSSVFSMASSSLAPSPQTTITPLRPKRKLSSSTLPPLRLLLSLLLPQTSYTDARASSLSSCLHPLEFGFCPCHCLQSHRHLLIIKPRACSSRSSPQAFSLRSVLHNGRPSTASANSCLFPGPHHPAQVLSSPSVRPQESMTLSVPELVVLSPPLAS